MVMFNENNPEILVKLLDKNKLKKYLKKYPEKAAKKVLSKKI